MMYPIQLRPCYKECLWGGTRLKAEFGKTDAPDVTAESWELSYHPDGMSIVGNGPYKGKTIEELCALDRVGFWGSECRAERFPVLVKLIDAAQMLSIQVHPSNENALAEAGEQGKAEMWYIVDCEPHAFIYYGFSKKISESEFLQRAEEGSICEVLNQVPVSKGDVFYILPGTIHAIGAGIVIAEIQQSSNTTFRVYDYQRKDGNGNLRPLHLERAAKVLDYTPVIPEECRANSMVSFSEFTMVEMFSCKYFRAYRIDIHTLARLSCDGRSFQHLLCVDGRGNIHYDGVVYPFERGESFLMPAALGEYMIQGKCRILLSRV